MGAVLYLSRWDTNESSIYCLININSLQSLEVTKLGISAEVLLITSANNLCTWHTSRERAHLQKI